MNWRGLILTGTSGAGKTTLSNLLRKRHPSFKEVRAVTTRDPRSDDSPGFYVHLSEEEFETLRDDLVIASEYRGKRYGITYSDIAEVVERGQIPVLVITARSLSEFVEWSASVGLPFLTVFVDAPNEVLDDRLRERSEIDRTMVDMQRIEDRTYRTATIRSLENLVLEQSLNQLLEWWEMSDSAE